jgi:transposase
LERAHHGEWTGLSKSTVHRFFQIFGLQPHRTRSFKLSTDPFFIEKLRDVVGLYLDPPDKALVLCVDEKSQIQALDRTQPMLPEGVTHDYERHGATTLFAALNVLDGSVLAPCKPRHRQQEFLAFLRHIEANVPTKLDIHLIVDNYATHKHPKVKAWLARRPRWHLHFTPTYASWLNQVERFFALITQREIRRGSFVSVPDLVAKSTASSKITMPRRIRSSGPQQRTPSSKKSADFVTVSLGQNTRSPEFGRWDRRVRFDGRSSSTNVSLAVRPGLGKPQPSREHVAHLLGRVGIESPHENGRKRRRDTGSVAFAECDDDGREQTAPRRYLQQRQILARISGRHQFGHRPPAA